MARKSSNRNNPTEDSRNEDERSNEDTVQHIKIPILDLKDVNNKDGGDYPKVYEETNDDVQPNSEEFNAPSREYDPPNYQPPNSGEIFDEDTYQQIVNSVKIPEIKFSGNEKDSDTKIDPDLQNDEEGGSPPEIPSELINIKIPTSIPSSSLQYKRKAKKKKKKKKNAKIKINKKPNRIPDDIVVEQIKNPDQEKEYSQVIDNSNPKKEVIIIKPVKDKKPNFRDFNHPDDFESNFHFPKVNKPKGRPIFFHSKPTLKIKHRRPKNINVIIQNKNKRPVLITHQNGDVIYWYPSKQMVVANNPRKNNKIVCKKSRYGQQCGNIVRRPMVTLGTRQKTNSFRFPQEVKTKPNHSNMDDDSFLFYKIIKSPSYKNKNVPGGVVKFGQSLFLNNHEENGSFFKEIDDQDGDEEGIDEPEAENHEDERITDEEVENDKNAPDEDEEGKQEEDEGNQQEQDINNYEQPDTDDYT